MQTAKNINTARRKRIHKYNDIQNGIVCVYMEILFSTYMILLLQNMIDVLEPIRIAEQISVVDE